MTESRNMRALARYFLRARLSGTKIATPPPESWPRTVAEANAVQRATASKLGRVGGYKVLQVGSNEGSWGLILGANIFDAPAMVHYSRSPLRIEVEPCVSYWPRPDRTIRRRAPYRPEDVDGAIASAFVAFELLESRLTDSEAPPLLARADMMGNWGLVRGRDVSDWRGWVHDHLPVSLTVGGRVVVSQVGGHPSGDPFHSLVWLANDLANDRHGLRAGDLVTTGAFGGSHPIAPGETARATIGNLGNIAFTPKGLSDDHLRSEAM